MNPETERAAVAAAWLEQAQGVSVPAPAIDSPAGMAERIATVARAAAARLPFGAEPSGFRRIFAALAGDDASGGTCDDR